jgi:hypothetical protein
MREQGSAESVARAERIADKEREAAEREHRLADEQRRKADRP